MEILSQRTCKHIMASIHHRTTDAIGSSFPFEAMQIRNKWVMACPELHESTGMATGLVILDGDQVKTMTPDLVPGSPVFYTAPT
ncbi:hypothetical protein TNCV_4360031 [Trichonephila clavipes]|uniref:Uncharacterized protein n=1 Tax=Trichonephila clavipes TaxID=2585209 RepID=A0A8X7BGS4_TRICX|nr:hypothetical protein TNCV_4360031 [Trichonephila clavipes]